MFFVDVLLQFRGDILDVPIPKESNAISHIVFRFYLQGPFNVHAHDHSNGDLGKEAIH